MISGTSPAEALPEVEPDGKIESLEVRPLIPTPERLSQLLEMDISDVETMYASAEQRGDLVEKIMSQQETLSEYHNNIYRGDMEELIRIGSERLADDPTMSIELLDETLHEVQNSLSAKRDFLMETSPDALPDDEKQQLLARIEESEEGANSEEERSMWRKAWDAVTWLPRKHPVITVLLAMAAAAWGLYAFWDQLAELIVVPNPIEGAGEVAGEIAAPTGGEVSGIPQGDIALPGTGAPGEVPVPEYPGEVVPDLATGTSAPPDVPAGSVAPPTAPTEIPPIDTTPLPEGAPPPVDGPPPPSQDLDPIDFFKDRPF